MLGRRGTARFSRVICGSRPYSERHHQRETVDKCPETGLEYTKLPQSFVFKCLGFKD